MKGARGGGHAPTRREGARAGHRRRRRCARSHRIARRREGAPAAPRMEPHRARWRAVIFLRGAVQLELERIAPGGRLARVERVRRWRRARAPRRWDAPAPQASQAPTHAHTTGLVDPRATLQRRHHQDIKDERRRPGRPPIARRRLPRRRVGPLRVPRRRR